MTDAETNQELSNEEVTERLNALYDELKSLKTTAFSADQTGTCRIEMGQIKCGRTGSTPIRSG